jgi:hypothetical protein
VLLILLDLLTRLTFTEDIDHKVPYHLDLIHSPLNCLQTRNLYKREFCVLGTPVAQRLCWKWGSMLVVS